MFKVLLLSLMGKQPRNSTDALCVRVVARFLSMHGIIFLIKNVDRF